MGKDKQIEFQPLGHRVLGALVSYIVPRLAADAAFKPGELNSPLAKLVPRRYERQIPGIVGVVKEQFKNRLAQDADLDDLSEILEALGEDPEEATEDKKMSKDKKKEMETEDAGGAAKIMAILKELDIPEDKMKEIEEACKGMAEDEEDDSEVDAVNDKKAADKKAADKKAADKKAADKKAKDEEDPDIEPKDVKQAMDAALPAIIKATSKSVADRFQAAKDVEPILGEVQPLAFDSASDIYKEALKHEKLETKGITADSFKPMFQVLMSTRGTARTQAPVGLTMDEASVKSYREIFKNVPAKM